MSFPRYPEYKDSGVDWLGEVPGHWEINQLKHQVRMRYGDALASEIREDGEIEVFGSNGPVGSHSTANTKAPAIVVGRKGSYGKIVWAENGGFVIDTAYAIDVDTTDANLRWVYFALQPLGLDSLSQDTGVPGLAREKAYAMPIAVPPFDEQKTIAAFLDRETAKIDALIAEQQRLIELLKEKRQTVISHAVTKGLNPNAPMKDSGIEWLGEVPEHWGITRLKFIANVQSGVAKGKDNSGQETVQVPYLRVANVQDGYLDLETVAMIEIPKTSLERYLLRVGDVLMNEGGDYDKLGRGHIWKGEIDPCIH